MLTLSLETALDGFSVALHYDKELLSSRFEPQARLASGQLLPMIESVLKEASSALGELTHLGVGRGPGSFTGIRLGLATVQALALGLKIPLITVTSFEVIASAFQLAHPHLVEDPIPTWLVVDTKGFQLGVARVSFFEGSIYEPHYGKPELIAQTCFKSPARLTGTGLERLTPYLPHHHIQLCPLPSSNFAEAIGNYLHQEAPFGLKEILQTVEPLYGLNPFSRSTSF